MFRLFGKVDREYPMENFILKVLHENKYDVEVTASIVYNKYPFVKKHDLKKVIAELITKKLNNEKIGGVWVKLKNKFKLVSKNYMDLAHDPRPAWDNSAKTPSDLGRANRFAIAPQGQEPDKYLVPKLDEVENIEKIELTFNQMKNKFRNALPGIGEDELGRIVKNEMQRMGFDVSRLEL